MSPRSVAFMTVLALSGCKSSPDIAGLVSGAAAGTATGSPAVGFLVGIGVRAAAADALDYYGRARQQAEQDAIAAVAGGLAEGEVASWRIRHDVPYGNEHGIVRVTRAMATTLAECREILFAVDESPAPFAWYVTNICRQAAHWKWAEAEPAVERWGFLQ